MKSGRIGRKVERRKQAIASGLAEPHRARKEVPKKKTH
jgi:hypothetical protein